VDAGSWGEPWRGGGAVAACADVAPVIHLRGPGRTTLRGPARLQGLLLVDGDLAIEGEVSVAGALVVAGRLDASSAVLRVDGAVLVRGGGRLGAGSVVRRSGCALERVTQGASPVTVFGRRGWSEAWR
jgi:hypothetical protein